MMDRDILLACRDASLGYEHRALLEHLTFTVRAGDYLCVVGENGSGKSTLINALIVALSLRKRDSVSKHFAQLESLWEKNRVYVGKENA